MAAGFAGAHRYHLGDRGLVTEIVGDDQDDVLGEGVGTCRSRFAGPGAAGTGCSRGCPGPFPGWPRSGTWRVTEELISWITLPASLVTLTVRLKFSPACTDSRRDLGLQVEPAGDGPHLGGAGGHGGLGEVGHGDLLVASGGEPDVETGHPVHEGSVGGKLGQRDRWM